MNAKTELFLHRISWLAGKVGTPTYLNLTKDFDRWAYHSRLYRRIQDLKAQGLIETQKSELKRDRFVRLTEAGRRIALGGRDPEEYWNQPWNRKWQLFLFDLPAEEVALRRRFLRVLRAAGCGCMQGSVWISPRIEPAIARLLREKGEDCSHLITLEADSKGRKVDRKMVRSAWNFSEINQSYQDHGAVLESFPANADKPEALSTWIEEEFKSWQCAVEKDPLLPRELLLPGYNGEKIWNRRKFVLEQAATLASRFADSGNEA